MRNATLILISSLLISSARAGNVLAAPSLKSAPKALPALTALPARPAVTIRPTATVSDTYFTLGEIADIKCADKDLAARLAAAPMGRAPLPGVARNITTGDVALKLRQVGIDPNTVDLAGATTVLITSTGDGASESSSDSSSVAGTAQSSADKTVVVHVGDAVNLIYTDDTITITARAVALQNGIAGQTIQLRRDGVTRTLQGTVLDSQTVRLED
ncbi:MAG TPA: flagella basal body P-ring formation protein FlgA [Capsulimonadaceae bacterium]|nr:flagella basal body P-ring formation protein FlgA [Capsulimonadaceae bacterium]